MKFEKWTALGNEYVILEAEALPWELTAERIRSISDPERGIGSDGVLLLSPGAEDGIVAQLRIFNPDGSEAELSGNGARQAVLYLRQQGWTDRDDFSIRTAAGEIRAAITGPGSASLEMGRASTSSKDFPSGPPDGRGSLTVAGRDWAFQHVSIGNPQCAVPVDSPEELEGLDLGEIGPGIENHPLFPNRTNVSFFRAEASRVRARIFERGVGETMSSGTGASGAAVAAHLAGSSSPITVELDGGELEVEISGELDVRLSGVAQQLESGEFAPELMQALADT